MASEAFVQGGSGVVPLSVVIAKSPAKAFWTLADKKIAADLYEDKNPGVTVRRDWESEAQHAARAKARETVAVVEPTQGMDPERAKPELLRMQRALQSLSVTHPQYDQLFDAWVAQIHALEDICGLKRTEYKKGQAVKAAAEEDVDPKLTAKLAEYFKRNVETRKASIAKTVDLAFLALIRDTEALPDLQMLAVQRIEQVKATP